MADGGDITVRCATGAGVLEHHIDVELRPRGIDRLIAELADHQHGVVARRQLLALGIGRGAIESRLASGRLHPIHRGVYAVGHRVVGPRGHWMAAVLAAGPETVLSHRSAAALWGIRGSSRNRTEVTLPYRRHQTRGIESHLAVLREDEITERDGIPVTSVPRTLFDLATGLGRAQVESAIAEAEVRRLTDPLSLDDLLERYPGRPGAPTIRAILRASRAGVDRTKSDLEEAFLDFIERNRLPRPETNVWLRVGKRWVEVDCLWRDQRVIAELDGRAVHLTAAAFESDRARDRALSVARWRPIRITWRHLHQGAELLEADLRSMLVTQALAARPQQPGGAPERLRIVA